MSEGKKESPSKNQSETREVKKSLWCCWCACFGGKQRNPSAESQSIVQSAAGSITSSPLSTTLSAELPPPIELKSYLIIDRKVNPLKSPANSVIQPELHGWTYSYRDPDNNSSAVEYTHDEEDNDLDNNSSQL